ncbi:MAG: family N-acetyltransferase [Firmicutes bacterium]|nr:family N-acetyltransferase [Bacillota bacterium]
MIQLSSLTRDDFGKILEWNSGKSADDLLQWAGPQYIFPLTHNQLEDYFSKSVNETSSVFIYKIVSVEKHEVIGTIELREKDKHNKIGRICRFLIGDETSRNQGLGKQVLTEILKIGFEDLLFSQITLGVFDFNVHAIHCYENTGFTKETFSKNAVKSWNLYEMAISKEHWQKLKR